MLQSIKNFDFFSQKFSFRAVKGSKTYQTKVGSLITILGLVISCLITFVNFKQYSETTKPVVSVNTIRMREVPPLNLTEHQVGLTLVMVSGPIVFNYEQMKKFVTFVGEIRTREQGSDGRIIEKVDIVDVSPCKELPPRNDETLEVLDSFICPNFTPEQGYVQGTSYQLPYRRYTTKIYPCSLPDPSQCATLDQLDRMSLASIPSIKVANFSNKKSPLVRFADSGVTYHICLSTKSVVSTYYKKNLIYDDDSDVFDAKISHSYIDVDRIFTIAGARVTQSTYCTKAQIEGGECEPYIELTMRSSSDKAIIQRRYKKFFSSASEVGGFADLIMYILYVVCFFYNYWSYQKWIRGQLVEHFLDLDKKNKGFGQNMSKERNRSISGVDSRKLERRLSRRIQTLRRSINASAKNLSKKIDFEGLFTKLNQAEMLAGLNFKSKILLEVIFREKKQKDSLEIMVSSLLFSNKRNNKESQNLIKNVATHQRDRARRIWMRSENRREAPDDEKQKQLNKIEKEPNQNTQKRVKKLFSQKSDSNNEKNNSKQTRASVQNSGRKDGQRAEIEVKLFSSSSDQYKHSPMSEGRKSRRSRGLKASKFKKFHKMSEQEPNSASQFRLMSKRRISRKLISSKRII